MRTVLFILSAFLLAAAAPGAQPERPAPQPMQADWLRGGREPEAVFGPRRLAAPAVALAQAEQSEPCGGAQRSVAELIRLPSLTGRKPAA